MTDKRATEAMELLRAFVDAVNRHDLITLGVACEKAEALLAQRTEEPNAPVATSDDEDYRRTLFTAHEQNTAPPLPRIKEIPDHHPNPRASAAPDSGGMPEDKIQTAVAIPIPGTESARLIILPQAASDKALTGDERLILALHKELESLRAYAPSLREKREATLNEPRAKGKYRLVYNKATKKIDKVSNFDGLAVESFDPPIECESAAPREEGK